MNETVEDLDGVRVFVRVVQASSFTGAARRLGMPKSTVSRRVADLEEALGARLLHRTTRKLSLTDVGRVYFARAERAIGALEDAERALSDLQDIPRGPLRVTAPVDMATSLLAPLVHEFLECHPEVSVHLEATNRRVDLVGEGYDLALRAGPRLSDSSLVARRLASSPSSLFAAPSYLKARGTPETLEELATHRFVLFRAERFEQRVPLTGPDGAEHELRAHGRLSCNDLGFLKRLALEGEGVALLPLMECAHAVRDGSLVHLLPGYRTPFGGVWAVYPSAQHVTPKVRAFVDFVGARLAKVIEQSEAAARKA